MLLSWSGRRQLLYYGVAALVLAAALVGGYQLFFTAAPLCNDGVQNGTETGVDCGGGCALLCPSESRVPVVLWSRSFPAIDTQYTAVAYVHNANAGAGARLVEYSFQLFDENNSLVVERVGVADLPPTATIPIVETGIEVGDRTVARTLFAFSELPVWERPRAQLPVLQITNQSLTANGERLSATVVNDSLINAERVVVAAVLFDVEGVARAASKSVVSVARQSSQALVFTWPGGIPNIVRGELTILLQF